VKILLVNPGQELALTANNPAIIDKERGKNPPLGILCLASTIRQAARHQVDVVDLNLGEAQIDDFKTLVRQGGYQVLGVSVNTFTFFDGLKVIDSFRDVCPGGKVIAGGPHVAVYPRETVALGVDVAVKREGEIIINQVLDRIGEPEALHEVEGICFRLRDEIIDTGEGLVIEDLDSLPLPDRALLPYKKYYSLLGQDVYSTTIITSRGCPFPCAFCNRPALGKKFRYHSSDYIINEILHCVQLGIREFLFYDDTFTVNRRRVMEVCDKIRERGLRIRWDIRTRVDTVDEEMLRALKQAGCCAIHYGVESGSPDILGRLNKGITIDRVKEVFRMTKAVGMDTLAYFMVGNPGETDAHIEESVKLISQIDPDYLHLTIFVPFPATTLYREALEKGIIKQDVYRQFAANPTRDFVPPIWNEHFTREQLQQIIKRVYRGFYMRPRYIFRRLRKLRSPAELRRKFKAGMSVMRMKD